MRKNIVWLLLIILLVVGLWVWNKGRAVRSEREFLHNLSLANKLFEEGNYSEALKLYETLLPRIEENRGEIFYRMGLCSYELDDFLHAREYWAQTPESYKDRIDFYQADMVLREGNPERAREMFLTWWQTYPEHPLREKVEKKIGKISEEMLYGDLPFPGSIEYEVKIGDSLYKIAKRFRTTVDLIMKKNKLKTIIIKPGDKLIVIPGKFSIEIDLSKHLLYLYYDNKLFKVYRIATGEGDKTPVGEFKVTDRLKNPVWYSDKGPIPPGSPENLLGSRWIGLNVKGIGIHEAINPEDIGKSITNGCIRMLKKDVEELYILVARGTPVVIKNGRVSNEE
ncbi:L,D-transpeptidase family protein [Candidatus Calescamantes bacterium]|nr:L,D-transpeptidase family protein [Candidatus Calescamantes bacterium]